jgi:predicted ribonuclease YlaK
MNFYDTSALLDLQEKVFEENFLISSITFTELEQIKSSNTRDEEIKYATRKVLHLLAENEDKYTILIPYNIELFIQKFKLPQNNDSYIIGTAYHYNTVTEPITFITSDLACGQIAKIVGIDTKIIRLETKEEYTGYKEIKMNDIELAKFYENILIANENIYELKINEYLLIIDNSEKIIDKYKWTFEGYKKVPFYKIDTKMFGKITPKDFDPYQQIALDSLVNNQITVLRGKPGSGKTYLGLGYLISLLEKGEIDKIIIFVNNVAVRGAAKLGFYPGTKDDKLLDSQIGNLLASKLGSITEVEKMVDDGTLVLVPAADCRGMDTSGMNAGVLMTEAQNTSVDMMKLILQRIGEDSKVVIDGDDKTQLDLSEYAGKNNGLRRVSEVFRGEDLYGEVTLQKIHRSRIATIAENMN